MSYVRAALTVVLLLGGAVVARSDEVLRAGLIGCDTSHAVAFTRLLNADAKDGALRQVRVVAAFPGGSPDLPASRDRVADFTDQVELLGVELVDSIAALVERCDVILLESVDGRVHLDQFRQAAVGKPVFIDKPAAASLADLLAIVRIADDTGTPCFSSSALRFCDHVRELQHAAGLGEILGAEATTPYSVDPTHPDLFWYAIHGVESLFALLGAGCESAACVESESAVIVVGRWTGGRLGVLRGIRQGKADYAFAVFGAGDIATRRGFSGYEPLVGEICQFFVSRRPPVDRRETIEIFAFMEAAHESRRRGGAEVALAEMVERAERESESRDP